MSSDSPTKPAPPSTLLSLPLELRHQIYTYALPSLIILPSIPRPLAKGPSTQSNYPLSDNTTYLDPAPSNPLVHGIVKFAPRFRVPTQAYPTSARGRVIATKYQPETAPHPLQLTCKQLCAETTRFAIKSGIWKFGFGNFEALIKFLKGRGVAGGRERFGVAREEWLCWIGSVMVQMALDVVPSASLQTSESGTSTSVSPMTARTGPDAGLVEARDGEDDKDQRDTVLEDQKPWFDALRLLTRTCPKIHTLGLHVALNGPKVEVKFFADGIRDPLSSRIQLVGPNAPASAAQDWPPDRKQPRADFHPTIERLLEYAESLKKLRSCGVTIRAGHRLRNLAADWRDGSCLVRYWEEADLGPELTDRIERLERGLDGVAEELYGIKAERPDPGICGSVADQMEAARQRLGEWNRDIYWY